MERQQAFLDVKLVSGLETTARQQRGQGDEKKNIIYYFRILMLGAPPRVVLMYLTQGGWYIYIYIGRKTLHVYVN